MKTVRKYPRMSYDEFKSSESYKRMYIKLLDEHPDLSSSQVHDWMRERYPDLPDVNSKTVYNFAKYVRAKYNIEKPVLSALRQYGKIEETAFGEYAQVDFSEMWMQDEANSDSAAGSSSLSFVRWTTRRRFYSGMKESKQKAYPNSRLNMSPG